MVHCVSFLLLSLLLLVVVVVVFGPNPFFVMNPQSNYLDPCQSFEDSRVEQELDMMFSLESLGLRAENPLSSFNKSKIDSFVTQLFMRTK